MKRIEHRRGNKQKDDKDHLIDKMRTINAKLKKRLKMLNQVVERAIDKTDTKRILLSTKPKPNPSHVSKVKDREIENAMQ